MVVQSIISNVIKEPCEATVLTKYFTMWSLVVHILLRKSRILDKRLLAQIVSIGGFYFTFIYPQKLKIKMKKRSYQVKGCELIVIDLLTHHLPYFYEYRKQTKYPISSKLCTLALVATYLCVHDVFQVYGIRQRDLCTISVTNAVLLLYTLNTNSN